MPTTRKLQITREEADHMLHPVKCSCGSIYDLGAVTVIARHADCSVWITECCRRQVDDRIPGWGGPRQYRDLVLTTTVDSYGILHPADVI